MEKVTAFALKALEGRALTTPPEMLRALIPPCLEYAKAVTGAAELRATFVLNALTPVDWALWQLYAAATGTRDFAALTAPFTPYLNCRQSRLGNIPLLSYDTEEAAIRALAAEGRFLFKIKIGSNPGGRNDLDEMLSWDCRRLEQIHNLLKNIDTPWTCCGHPVYYLDANGRYDTAERVSRFLDFTHSIGALDRIVLLEEPFAEDNLQNVSSLPVTVAADESAHSAADAIRLMDKYGYRAMALKPIAKTLSVSLEVLNEAGKRGVPCFCADLTVNPAMAEENKRFAASLQSLPGLNCGAFESNGSQNYAAWAEMEAESPAFGKSWSRMEAGLFPLNDDYYAADGGIWEIGGDANG